MTEHAGGEWRPWAKAAPMNAAVRSREVPSFVAITLKTGSGWTDGAGVCSICTAIVLDREAHRVWHGQFVHVLEGAVAPRCHFVIGEDVIRTTECPHEP